MNGDSPHGGQPWSVDLLADLHADGADRSRLDADALAVLAALDATQAELAQLPPMRMPDDVAARIDAALAAESAARGSAGGSQAAAPPVAPVVDLAEARRRRNRRLGVAGGLLIAAAAAVGVVVVTLPGGTTGGTPQAVPLPTTGQSSIQTDPQNTGPLTLRHEDLPAAGTKVIGSKDYGPLTDPAKLSACLVANGIDGATKPLYGRQASIDNRPAEMLLLSTGKQVRFRLLVVGADCAAGNPATIADSVIGH